MRTLVAAFLLLWSSVAVAADAPTIAVSGLVTHPQTLTLAALQAFPKQTASVSYMTGGGERKGTYTGAHLWDILKAAAIKQDGKNSDLKRTVWVEGSDGYSIVMALSELDPDYGNHDALVAYKREDAPGGGFRLVIPSDRHGGRYVTDVVKIEVK
jgi:hypothetical protein